MWPTIQRGENTCAQSLAFVCSISPVIISRDLISRFAHMIFNLQAGCVLHPTTLNRAIVSLRECLANKASGCESVPILFPSMHKARRVNRRAFLGGKGTVKKEINALFSQSQPCSHTAIFDETYHFAMSENAYTTSALSRATVLRITDPCCLW